MRMNSLHNLVPVLLSIMLKFTLSQIKEPVYFAQPTKDPNWVTTMNKELHALEENNTWNWLNYQKGKPLLVVNGYIKLNILPMVILRDVGKD